MAGFPKFQTKEVLNKVLNSGEDALKVDIDNVTLKTEGSDITIEVHTDKAEDSMLVFSNTTKDGSGTSYVPLIDSDGHLQVDALSTALPSGAATEAKQDVIETTLNAIQVDADAIETLLTGIDADTNAIKVDADAIETLITSTNSKIDTFDAVLDNILTKNTEIDSVLDTIKVDTEAIETAVELLDNAISGTEMQVDVVAISAQSDGTYIGDIKFGESLPAGSAAIGKLAANSGVDIGDVDVTSIVPGTGATNLGKAEDAAHSSGDVGVMPLAVRNDDIAALGGADGDYAPLQVNAAGSLYTMDETGQAGSILVTGTTAVTSPANTKFIAIQFIEDTVFDSGNDGLISATNQLYPSTQYTGTDIDGDGGAVADSVSFPQGMTIFGRWSGFKLASGKVIGYIGYV